MDEEDYTEMKIIHVDYDDPMYMPEYQSWGAACADLVSAKDIKLPKGKVTKVYTGIRVAVDKGWELQIRGRSGLSSRGIMLANGVGTIDSDYRGKVYVLLYNSTDEDYWIQKGDRIAQALVSPTVRISWARVDIRGNETERGEGGFGSTDQ
jgi:dUTP pyrophosphatase